MTIRVGINGFGRIGRNFWRAVHAAQAAGPGGQARDIEIVAANDLGDMATFAHLLKYDTVLGTLDVDVYTADGAIVAGDQRITWLAERYRSSRLVGWLARLLSDRPLARRPCRRGALARPFPQPRARLGPRHRPRLSA